MNHELPDVQGWFRKDRRTRDQIANICWIIKKAREFQKNLPLLYWLRQSLLTVWITTNCGKFFKRWEYQTTLTDSWEIYAGQEATVRTGHGTTDWFQIGKGVRRGCILSPCLFNLYAEHIMQNARIKLESRLLGEISIISDTQMTPPLRQKVKKN